MLPNQVSHSRSQGMLRYDFQINRLRLSEQFKKLNKLKNISFQIHVLTSRVQSSAQVLIILQGSSKNDNKTYASNYLSRLTL
jgi:hypothetical protein